MAAGFFPRANDPALCLGANFLAWLFAFQDLLDATPFGQDPRAVSELLSELTRVLDGQRGAVPLSRALGEISLRLCTLACAEDLDRFLGNLHAHFEGVRWQAGDRAAQVVPDESVFGRLHPLARGLPGIFALIEPLEGIDLPAAARAHPSVKALCRLAGGIISQVGDVLSWPRDQGATHNLVTVVARAHHLGPDEALAQAIQRTNQNVRDFLIVEAQHLPAFGEEEDRAVARYLGVLRSMIATTFACTARAEGHQPP
jgi:hypothetical protein